MITRKTRFISGLAAILMLVSMFTAFVLPATADDAALYPYLRDMETLGRDSATDWGIGSAEDWKTAIALNKAGETFAGMTLHFTADIDFDVDGSGEVEKEEYIDALGNDEYGFAGNINGHGHVINNLYVDHDVTTEGMYTGLIGRGTGTNTIRDLGLASGTVNIHGSNSVVQSTENNCVFTGAFMGRHTGTVTFANCWTAVNVTADVEIYEIDMAPFGRVNAVTLVNCYNVGNLTAKNTATTQKTDGSTGTGATRVDALYDWAATVNATAVNCFSITTMTGSGQYMFSFGSWADNATEYAQLASQTRNVYVSGISSVSNKSGLSSLLTEVKIDDSEYHSGELASKLNENYDDTYDSLYGHKYYTIEDGKTVFTDDPYESVYTLTVSKKIGDYVVESETTYHKAVSTIQTPVFEGYELTSYTDAIFLLDDGTFRMPAVNATMEYTAQVPDWSLIEEMIEKYQGYKISGQHKLMVNGAAILELLEKLEWSYANKDTMDDATALKRIALYVEEDANLDLSMKEGLTYPNYPYVRNFEVFGQDASADWAIASPEDWKAAIEMNSAGETFAGETFHFVGDLDFKSEVIDSLGTKVAFNGDIDGHGHVIKNLAVEHDISDSVYGALIGRGNISGQVIRDLGIASGTVTITGSGSTKSGGIYAGVFMSYDSAAITFANCWNAADLIVNVEKYEADCTIFGRLTAPTLINCYNLGNITAKATNGRTCRVDGLFDWGVANTRIFNAFAVGELSASGGNTYNQMYLFSIGNSANDDETLTTIGTEQIKNLYGTGMDGISNRSTLNKLLPDTEIDASEISSGELAWKLNKNYDTTYDETYGRKYYTVKDGQTVFGTEADQAVRIAVNSKEGISYYYAVVGQTVDLNGIYTVGAPTFTLEDTSLGTVSNGVLTLTAVPANEDLTAVVNVSFRGGLDFGALNEAIASKDGDLANYFSKLSSKPLADVINEMKVKVYETQEAIDADVELLNSYKFMAPITQYATNPDADGYSVASKADMDYLATIFTDLSKEQTVYITANIDMQGSAASPNASMAAMKASIDGMNHTISNLYVTSAWLGKYAGASVKDLTFKDCTAAPTAATQAFLITTVENETEISNVTLDHVTVNHGYTGAAIYGLLVASLSDGDLTMKDIKIVNSTFNRGDYAKVGTSTSTYCNSGMVLAKTYKGTLNVDGVYLNNNTITGNRTGSGTGVAFGEIICDATIKNVVALNTTVSDSLIRGIFASVKEGSTSSNNPVDPKIAIENVIAYNNGETVNCIVTAANAGKGTTIKNVYTDTTNVISAAHASITVTDGYAEAETAIQNGEAAYQLNTAGAALAMEKSGDTYLPEFATEGKTVKVTFENLAGATVATLYTDADGKLIGLTDDIYNAVIAWEGYETKAALEAATFTEDTTVKQAECQHNYNKVYNGDGTHTITCTTPGGCGSVEENVPCSYTYTESTDGETHMKKCTVCEHEESEACEIEMSNVKGSGKHTASCAKCKYSAEETCTFTETYVPHTNITKGYTHYTCECGDSYDVYDTEMKHDWDTENATTVKEPTYGEDGVSRIECSVCDAYKEEAIAALTGTGIVVNVPQSAQPGESIDVTLELANNPGIAGLNLEVTYDTEVLTLNSITDGELFGYFESVKDDKVENANGTVPMAFLEDTNVTAAETDGKALVTLNFTVKEDAALAISTIEAKMRTGDEQDTANTGASDENSQYVAVGNGKAVVEIVDYTWGDADDNGETNLVDAQTILRWRVGKIDDQDINLVAADADRNGKVSIADAILLLQWQADLVEWDPFGWTKEPIAE